MKRISVFVIAGLGILFIAVNFIGYKKIDKQEAVANCILNFQKNAKKEYEGAATIKIKLTFYGSKEVANIRKIYAIKILM